MSEQRIEQAIELIDQINQRDPVTELVDGVAQPKEWLYGIRMSECLAEFMPDASTALQIAARAQHIKRWSIPRSDHPMGREGYYKWRQSLGRLHAEEAMAIAVQVGCSEDEVQAIGRMLRKEKIKRDPQVQALEDVICLVFLKHYFSAFAEKHTPEKLIVIVQKTWAKMSEQGHEAALKLPFTPDQQALLAKALS
ncbi:DUF4202 domain-containing protein [Moritella marina ATCC 15381]|uniref:DUF4202 domain-containing protein n=1 Tax=Moritella marina ATCC 15381 TaxID=1202962 RepID=A0A5J6WRY9_MORMI|nr:DUF4202 domain-containing protein [Moritella marina]QFI39705.1 DUF4202 domain-containing protein [Moritella marina ATCC 15381]